MKTVSCWNDLGAYGIIALTGESCGLGYRILCDVTAKGKKVVEKCLGVSLTLPENWNSGSPDNPHVGCIMLAPELLVPLAVFALLEHGCTEVWLYKNQTLRGIESIDRPEEVARWKEFNADTLVRTFAYRGTAGDRNVHQMSGRIQ